MSVVPSEISTQGSDDDSVSTVSGTATSSTINVEDYDDEPTNTRKRIFIVTLMRGIDDPVDDTLCDPDTFFPGIEISRWASQTEICATTQRTHVHFFVQFKTRQWTFASLRKRLVEKLGNDAGINIKAPPPSASGRGGREISKHIRAMHRYCIKEQTRHPDSIPRVEGLPPPVVTEQAPVAEPPQKKNKSINDRAIEYMVSHAPTTAFHNLLHKDLKSQKLLGPRIAWAQRFWQHYQENMFAAREPRTINEVIILTGGAGSGKTTWAKRHQAPDDESVVDFNHRVWVQTQNMGRWWGDAKGISYENQSVIIIDEMHSGHPIGFTDFKSLANIGHSGEFVQVKNGSCKLNHSTLIITSNCFPWKWWKTMLMQNTHNWDAFTRRVTKWMHFPILRPDGTRNSASLHGDFFFYEKKLPGIIPSNDMTDWDQPDED